MKDVLRLVTIVGLLSIGMVAGGCIVGLGGGGGDALTLEEFFAEVEALDNTFEADSDEIDAQFSELTEEEALEQAPDLLQQQADIVRDFINGLDDLEAPDEAVDLQEEAVSAGRAVADTFEAGLDDTRNAETLDELFAVFDDADFTAAIERFDQACLDAEALAAENDITVDLNCEE